VVAARGLTNHSNHARSRTGIQQGLVRGYTLSQVTHPQPLAATSILAQDWVNRLQLAGQEAFDPAFAFHPYTDIGDPQLTRVPGAPGLAGPWAETVPHLGHSINLVSTLLYPVLIHLP
jgi:hypothetical protein